MKADVTLRNKTLFLVPSSNFNDTFRNLFQAKKLKTLNYFVKYKSYKNIKESLW